MLKKYDGEELVIKYGSKGYYDIFDYTNKERYSYDIKIVKNHYILKEETFKNNIYELIYEDKTVGYFAYSISNKYLIVDLYYILDEFRKSGYSELLNKEIEKLIIENKLESFYFLVNNSNTEFINFLFKKGFIVVGFIKVDKLDIKLYLKKKIID